jgi:putative oxidoreductase
MVTVLAGMPVLIAAKDSAWPVIEKIDHNQGNNSFFFRGAAGHNGFHRQPTHKEHIMETSKLYPAGRALVGLLFIVSGINKVLAFGYVAGWMGSLGLPFASLLLAAAIALEIGGGLALATGFQARWASLGLALFLVPVTLIFHAFWGAAAAEFQNQLNHFLKNVAILGAMLVIFEVELQRERQRRQASAGAILRTRAA